VMGRLVLLMCAMWRAFPEQIVSEGNWMLSDTTRCI